MLPISVSMPVATTCFSRPYVTMEEVYVILLRSTKKQSSASFSENTDSPVKETSYTFKLAESTGCKATGTISPLPKHYHMSHYQLANRDKAFLPLPQHAGCGRADVAHCFQRTLCFLFQRNADDDVHNNNYQNCHFLSPFL